MSRLKDELWSEISSIQERKRGQAKCRARRGRAATALLRVRSTLIPPFGRDCRAALQIARAGVAPPRGTKATEPGERQQKKRLAWFRSRYHVDLAVKTLSRERRAVGESRDRES